MNIKDLFQINRLFELQPPSSFKYSGELLVWFGSLLLISIFLTVILNYFFAAKKDNIKRLFFQKIARYYMLTALMGIALVLARRQYIAFFSMRLFLVVLLLTQIGMIGYFLYEARKEFPQYQKKYKFQLEKEKYLPKRKHK